MEFYGMPAWEFLLWMGQVVALVVSVTVVLYWKKHKLGFYSED